MKNIYMTPILSIMLDENTEENTEYDMYLLITSKYNNNSSSSQHSSGVRVAQ